MPRLKIYKASAGSGKTFQLVREYLFILFNNPDEFQHVLGVTFTNKATGEMKSRILKELNKLASGENSDHLQALTDYFNKPEAWVRKRASMLFSHALHRYHEFHIQTIDSFFQRLIRGFARDIGLSAGFNLELDTEKVLKECIWNLIEDLKEGSPHSKLLIEFSSQKIEDSKSWDLQDDLFKFSKEVFREKFSSIADEIIAFAEDEEKVKSLNQTISSQVNQFEHKMKMLGEKGLEIMRNHDLTVNDFKNKKGGFASVFEKAIKKDFDFGLRTYKAVNNLDEWYAKATDKEVIDRIHVVYPLLNSCLSAIIDLYENESRQYYAANNAKDYLYQLGVMSLVLQYIRKYRDEQDVILMPDTGPLINHIVKQNDEAFIYEKAGAYFHHFLLDEFQDTSELQWENFKPLISNSISQDYVSLLVGDVKQSIYRFRNSDWKLLMYKAQQDIPYSDVIPMDTNYRSAEMIVRFNNTLFSLIPSWLGSEFKKEFDEAGVSSEVPGWFELAYANQAQKFNPAKGKGYVCIKNFLKEDEIGAKEQSLNEMIKVIKDALLRGYQLRDIVILCRKENDSKVVYDYLLHHGNSNWKVVSEQSLQLRNNGYVRMIMYALQWLANSQNTIARAGLITEVIKYKLQKGDDTLGEYIKTPPFQLIEFFEQADSIRQMTITDMLIKVHELFHESQLFQMDDLIFFQSFVDEVLQFMKTGDHTLNELVHWIETQGQYQSVRQSENLNAIRIMTVHKSKGLEFPIVIIPFFNWKLDHDGKHTNILWEKPHPSLGWNVPVIPLQYKSELKNSFFAHEYLNEKFAAAMDALNLMYVALTRPVKELYVFLQVKPPSQSSNSSSRYTHVGNLLLEALKTEQTVSDERDLFLSFQNYYSKDDQQLELGEKRPFENKKHSDVTDDFSFVQDQFSLKLPWDSISVKSVSGAYPDYFNQEQRRGVIIHELLSKVRYMDDFQRIIAEVQLHNGEESAYALELKQLRNEFESDAVVATWFDSKSEVFTEQPVIDHKGNELRPDRIVRISGEIHVIDFKTGEPDDKYIHQVKRYKEILQTIYNEPVKGYLVYVLPLIVQEVD